MQSVDIDIPIKCPRCGKQTKQRLARLKDGAEFTCSCGATFKVDGDGFASAQKGLDDLIKSIRKIGK